MPQINQTNSLVLFQILVDRFSDDELRTLCFHLQIDYEELSAEGKSGKIRELIEYLQRRHRVHELVSSGKQLRPDVIWEDVVPFVAQLDASISSDNSRTLHKKSPRFSPFNVEIPLNRIVVLLGVLAIGILMLARGPNLYNWFIRYRVFAPGLTPVRLSFAQSNSRLNIT